MKRYYGNILKDISRTNPGLPPDPNPIGGDNDHTPTTTTASLLKRAWADYRGWTVFIGGIFPVYLLSLTRWSGFSEFGGSITSFQFSQFGGTVLAFAVGFIGGFLPVLLLFLFLRFRDISLAVIGLLVLFFTLSPGIGMAMPYTSGPFGVLTGLIVAWLVLFGFSKLPKPTTFGSAEWADAAHIETAGLFAGEGYWLGTFTVPGKNRRQPPEERLIRYNGDRHLLTIAPTRSGKGVSAIIPNLLTYKGSVIVIDPKGENVLKTILARHRMQQKIHVVDPWGIATEQFKGRVPAACFNPLDWLRPDDPDIGDNALILADALVVKTPGSKEPFWDEEAKALLMGLILHVATSPAEQRQRHLGRVRDLLLLTKSQFDNLLTDMLRSPHPVVVGTAARTAGKDEKLLSSVMASAQAHTHFLDSPRIRASLSRSDFRFEDLKSEAATVYLVLPADRLDAFGRWLRLLIQQAITVNARNISVAPQKPILFMLDEMSALGRLTMVEQAYGLMAGFGMQMWGIVQDASQLKRLYQDGWETFISNSGCITYYGSRDVMTAEYFSKIAGITTINSISRSISHAVSSALGSNSTTTNSTNVAEGQRNLANPDELMRLKDGRQLVLIENMNPIQATRIKYHEHPELKALSTPSPAPSQS